ncbi:MAG: methyltransferase domain-containing protein [Planctomycetes bacterium]|nr:methyltransferase domain-containing protein [Planctomycetota bacterium]
MRPRLLEHLACPACGGGLDLEVHRWEGEEAMEGLLGCAPCGTRWPIRGGVPRFVASFQDASEERTARNFGHSWNTYPELDPLYERQFLDWVHPLGPEDFRGRTVLDAGCGKGRHLVLAARWGATEAIGVDLSLAVDTAFRHARGLPNAHVVQASLLELPLRGGLDLAYSVGVLHHLQTPEAGLRALAAVLAPGGRLAAWVYGREGNGWVLALVDPLRRFLSSRTSPRLTRLAARAAGVVLHLITRGVYGPLDRHAPALAPLLPYHDYLRYVARFPRRELESIAFDHLTAPVAHYVPRGEFLRWFAAAGLGPPLVERHHRNSWRGLARRSAAQERPQYVR